jgi:hypothetical protein
MKHILHLAMLAPGLVAGVHTALAAPPAKFYRLFKP